MFRSQIAELGSAIASLDAQIIGIEEDLKEIKTRVLAERVRKRGIQAALIAARAELVESKQVQTSVSIESLDAQILVIDTEIREMIEKTNADRQVRRGIQAGLIARRADLEETLRLALMADEPQIRADSGPLLYYSWTSAMPRGSAATMFAGS